MRSPKLCDVADVTKVAACGPGRSGRVGEIGGSTYAMPHNFMRSTKVLLNEHPGLGRLEILKFPCPLKF